MMRHFIYSLISAIALLILLPIFLVISVLIILSYGKPVLFKQKRTGKNGKPFTFYKFRTMTNEVNEKGELLEDGKRITLLGKFLRASSIDELPSLFNVMLGEMSLVGPRPLLLEYLNKYDKFQKRRLEVKPGITGWSQINGRNKLSWENKFKLDVWYVDNQSFYLDIKILLITLIKVLGFVGINQDGHATMNKFRGNGDNER